MNIRLTSTRAWNEAKEDLANEPGWLTKNPIIEEGEDK